MYVKLLDGRFAGEVKELEPGAALDLIAVGRAERAFQEPAPEAPIVHAEAIISPSEVRQAHIEGPAVHTESQRGKKKTR